jgi:hypothetical protein
MNQLVTNEKSEVLGLANDIILGADRKPNFALIDVGARVSTRA